MSMSDLVSSMNVTLFPILGLIIFVCVFGVLVVRTLLADPSRDRLASHIPLDEDQPTTGPRPQSAQE